MKTNLIQQQASFFEEIDRIFLGAYTYVPDGYKLVEDEDHKRKRITDRIESSKKMLEYHEGQIEKIRKRVDEDDKELLSLKQ